MSTLSNHVRWLRYGKRKRAVAQVLRKPMTPKEIWQQAVPKAPRLRLRDVASLLRSFLERNLASCLTPEQPMGSLYAPTDCGRHALARSFGMQVDVLPEDIAWDKYSLVARAKRRRTVLIELAHPRYECFQEATASNIRKNLRDRHPMGLNQLLRTLKELVTYDLVRLLSSAARPHRNVYQLVPSGKRIVEQLLR